MADGLLNKASIILTPTGYKAGTLYNVAPVVEPYEDFDFARASVASRVNSSGLVEMVGRTFSSELVTNGDFATDSNWSTTGTWDIVNNQAEATANSTSQYLQQDFSITNGNVYKFSYEIIENTLNGNGASLSSSGGFGSVSLSNVVGTHTEYITASNDSATYALKIGVSGTATSGAIKIDNVSVKEIIDTNNIPRISYDSNGDNGHILLEPTSTNLVPYSEDFSQWANVSATLTPNQSSPDGSDNAYIIEDDNPSAYERVDETITTAASSHTFSVFIKKKTSAVSSYGGIQMGTGFSYVIFDSYNGTYNQQSNTNYDSIEVENFNSDWWRLKLTATLTTSTRVALWGAISTNGTSISTSATGSETYFGAQLEALSYSTSYIPTLTGSTVTRATETATGAGSADLINSTEGVLYAEIAAFENTDDAFAISLNDGSSTNRIFLTLRTPESEYRAFSTGGGDLTFQGLDVTNISKIAVRYSLNNFSLWVNGVKRKETLVYAGIPSNTLNNLSFDRDGVGELDFYGKVKALAVFNEALSDDELHNLTG